MPAKVKARFIEPMLLLRTMDASGVLKQPVRFMT
jgi:hypothetical protein